MTLWCASLFIILLHKAIKDSMNDQPKDQTLLISALFNFLSWCLCFLINTFLKADTLFSILPTEMSRITDLLQILYCPLFGLALVSSYIFVIAILYQSFKSSEFQTTRCFISMHITIAILLFLSSTFAEFLSFVVHSLAEILKLSNLSLFVFCINNLVSTLNLKLIKMMIMAVTNSTIPSRTKTKIHCRSQSKLLQTVTKFTVLQTVFTVTAISYIITSVLNHLVFQTDLQILNWLTHLIGCIVVKIGTLCIYLTFKLNDKEYNMCCFGCNRCCTTFCKWFIHKLYGSDIMMNDIKSMRRKASVSQRFEVVSHSKVSRMTSGSTVSRPTTETAESTTIIPLSSAINRGITGSTESTANTPSPLSVWISPKINAVDSICTELSEVDLDSIIEEMDKMTSSLESV